MRLAGAGLSVTHITEPWNDPDDEYRALVDLFVPAAQAQYDHMVDRWTSLDAKAFGFLAIVAAVIGGLAATHESIHQAWWGAAAGSAIAGGFFIGALWPRDLVLGPDLVDFHDEARVAEPLTAAREMLDQLASATENAEEGYDSKSWFFQVGLAVLAVSLAGSLLVVLFHP